jgi:uncharacterized protein (DUF433 family)
MDWSRLDIIEIIPGKVSGAPLLMGTRIPASAIIENYEAFLEEGNSPEKAIAETLECYPTAGEERIQKIIEYHYAHQHQPQS